MPSVHRENNHDQDQLEKCGVLDLSNHGLKSTECLPGGISPFTLLLNNNEVSKVENLQYFVHLQQLSLADNHIVNMKGTGAAINLRVLDLSNNSVVEIEGLDSLQKLEWLNLSGNSIEKIQNLDNNTNLYHLDLSDNSIAALSGLRALKKLKTLLVHGNLISSLAVIKEQLSSTIQTLSLADNEVLDLTEMVYLSSLVNLEQLTVLNNPCVMPSMSWRLEVHFRPYLLYCCAGLRNLDGFLVSDEERMLSSVLDRAFREIGHPSHGQHVQLVFTLHHLCSSGQQDKAELSTVTQGTTQDDFDDANWDKVLESESFYLPVPSPDRTLTIESDDPIMSDEEAFRLLSLAATIIQAHVRGFLVRRKFDFYQYRKRKHAAILIQATWRGYRARTLDIKVINVRNELRLERLISVIDHLATMLEREQEKAATNRAQVLQAVRYLWQQIREQNKANQIRSHRKEEKAALKLQSWWRGCLVRKAYPHISRNTGKDKIHILFATCFSLQKQLNFVTSQIREMQQDVRRKEISPLEDLSGSDRQEQYYDTTAKLDTSEENNALLSSCSEYDQVESNMASSSNTQLESIEEDSTVSYCEREPIEGDMDSESNSQIALLDDNMASSNIPWEDSDDRSSKDNATTAKSSHQDSFANNPVPPKAEPLGSPQDNVVPFIPEPPDPQNEVVPLNTELVDSYHCNMAHSNAVSLNPQLSNVAPSNAKRSCDNTVASSSVREQGHLQSTTLASASQSINGYKVNFVAEKLSLQVGQDGTAASEDVLSGGDQHRVTIPKIVVSSPAEDECSDRDSASEEDAIDVTSHPDKPGGGDPSKHCNGSRTEKSSFIEQPVTSHAKKGDFLSKHKQADQPIASKVIGRGNSQVQKSTSFSEMRDEKYTESNPVKQCKVEFSKGALPNLGERATNLLSQLRSEIASMKSARLSNVSLETEMVTVSENEKENDVVGEKKDEVKLVESELGPPAADSQVEPGGMPQAGSAAVLTYRLPLFEDVAMSFSLDDLLVDADGEGNGEPFTTVTVATKSCSTTDCDEGFRSDDTNVSFDTKL